MAIGVIATPAARRAGRLRPAGRGRRDQHPQLRAGGALGAGDGVDVRKVDLSIELQILAFHEQRKSWSTPGRPDALDGGRA